MARLGPFEARPRLAVGVSGGPDSLALCLLAHRWAATRGGSVLALTVDHGLRPEAADEALIVRDWLTVRGVLHQTLRWTGEKPASAIQAAAREARYRLLSDACRAAGILHLLIGHHADDQAETVALRRARGSGEDGLAGIPAVREVVGVRLVRPLLDVPKTRLRLTLRAIGQVWLEDPSNASPRFARGRLRAAGLDRAWLVALAQTAGTRRRNLDRQVAHWLACHARIDPAGFVALPSDVWATLAERLARRVLLQSLATVGGRRYPPREVRLRGLLDHLRSGPIRRTLAGCRVLRDPRTILICREPAAIGPPVELAPGRTTSWDGRFEVTLPRESPPHLQCRAIGQGVHAFRAALRPISTARPLPAAILPGLPSLWRGDQPVAVPHLQLAAPGFEHLGCEVRFRPRYPLAGPPFAIAEDASRALLGLPPSLY